MLKKQKPVNKIITSFTFIKIFNVNIKILLYTRFYTKKRKVCKICFK